MQRACNCQGPGVASGANPGARLLNPALQMEAAPKMDVYLRVPMMGEGLPL
jgi:hypothetical protein